ncbi:MAG: protocatechuate 3,4-dioxygenase subunit alpha [Deltaproteobacteria bacterium]|nr:protocatechuate 3,4-dioxygenase subunit alpha [Deltaproteobacteria bacterium]
MSARRGTTPSQTVGPFHRIMVPWEGGAELVPPDDPHAIRIEGRILDGAGQPVDDSVVEVWQANVHGRYAHAEDTREVPLVEGFDGFGRAIADGHGRFTIVTVKPGCVPGPGDTVQAPHICLLVFARGLLKQLVTRVYFADEAAANEQDPMLLSIKESGRRDTLLAVRREGGGGPPVYEFDIHLQGSRETVFFDL